MNPYSFLNRYVQTFPMIRPSIKPESAISRSRSLAYRTLHPACSATSTGWTLAVNKAVARAFKKTSSEYTSSNLELSDILKNNTTNKLNFRSKYYDLESHGSVPLIATYDALHFIYDFYNFPMDKSDYADTTMSVAFRMENHYKNVSAIMGYKISPSESIINTLGYNALSMKNFKLSEYLFKLNIENYPNSNNAFDSMGDYFSTVGDYEQAKTMYNKALLIYDNIETRKKLENIQKH